MSIDKHNKFDFNSICNDNEVLKISIINIEIIKCKILIFDLENCLNKKGFNIINIILNKFKNNITYILLGFFLIRKFKIDSLLYNSSLIFELISSLFLLYLLISSRFNFLFFAIINKSKNLKKKNL